MQDYRKREVWQKAHKLALNVFAVSAYLKAPESWALRDQVLRAAISIPSNIAEGRGRGSDPDFCKFLWYSMGSCNELEYDLFLAKDLSVMPRDKHAHLSGQGRGGPADADRSDSEHQIVIGLQLKKMNKLETGSW